MNVSPEDLVAIGTVVSVSVQIMKRLLPGDWDSYGVLLTGIASMTAVMAWMQSNAPHAGLESSFEVLTLWITVYGTATGVYETARMVTATKGRSFKKLRAERDAVRPPEVVA